MAYTQVWDHITKAASATMIQRDADGAFIPDDSGNADWQAYQAWLSEGNLPNPPVRPSIGPNIAASSRSLKLSNAKSLAAQGRTDEAMSALIDLMENPV
jgi:hypothetical protein